MVEGNVEYIDLEHAENRQAIFAELRPIINDNLVENGGTLLQGDLLTKDYDWSHLFVVRDNGKVVVFDILRHSDYDQHQTGYDEYYYISDIVIARSYQNHGIGTRLVQTILRSIDDLPVVASVRKTNVNSLRLFRKNLKVCSESGKYYRFLDQRHFDLRQDPASTGNGQFGM